MVSLPGVHDVAVLCCWCRIVVECLCVRSTLCCEDVGNNNRMLEFGGNRCVRCSKFRIVNLWDAGSVGERE